MTANIVVTGGAGYVGSHVCKALSVAGYRPITFDNLCRGNKDAVKWGPLEIVDMEDRSHLTALLEKYMPATVIHMAAYTYVGESTERPDLYFRNNLIGTLSLAEAMVAAGRKNIVFSSSCAVYGSPDGSTIDEHTALAPRSPYAASKVMAEQILMDFSRSFGLSSVSLRYFNAAGADPEAEIGESHDPETHLIPRAIQAAKGEIDALELFGTDYETPDGTAIRDYVHVSDLAQAHLAAMAYLQNGGPSTAFNLGNDRGYSVREILAAVAKTIGHPVPVKEVGRRLGDAPTLVANSSKAKLEIGWQPQYSDIETIISTAVRWNDVQSNPSVDIQAE